MEIRDYFKKARREGWAVGHFNISNLETLWGIVRAARNLKSPVIIGTSEREGKFIGFKQAAALVKSFREEFKMPIFLNLDHGKTFAYIKEAIDAGYDLVQSDCAELSLQKNIIQTRKAAAIARKKKIIIEGEVGAIGGELTDPNDAEKFIRETKVDNLAINIGTFHGAGAKRVDIQRLKKIKEKVGDRAFLVMHGGSGVPADNIKEAIKSGINIIHINTELRIAFTSALRGSLAKNPAEFTPYKYMPDAADAVQKIVEEKILLFNSNNKI